MAEETKTTEGTPAPNADAAAQAAAQAAEAAKVRASEERWTKIETRINALADTVQGALAPRQQVNPGDAKPGDVPAHFRQLLRQQGLTDADINANAPIIVPFLSAMLATDGAVMLGGIQQVKDEVEMVKASRSPKKFPYWGEVEDAVAQMREDAAKQGRYLNVSDAYQAAVATDIASAESKIEKAKEARRSASHSDDVTTSTDVTRVTHGSRDAGSRRTAKSAEDLATMSRAERKKLIEESYGDQPIR